MNLLPIPVLDGGNIAQALLEGVTRRPLSARARTVAQGVGPRAPRDAHAVRVQERHRPPHGLRTGRCSSPPSTPRPSRSPARSWTSCPARRRGSAATGPSRPGDARRRLALPRAPRPHRAPPRRAPPPGPRSHSAELPQALVRPPPRRGARPPRRSRATRSASGRAPSPACGSASRRGRGSPTRTAGRSRARRASPRWRSPRRRTRRTGALLVPLLDARKGEVYAGFYRAARRGDRRGRGRRRPRRRRRSPPGSRSSPPEAPGRSRSARGSPPTRPRSPGVPRLATAIATPPASAVAALVAERLATASYDAQALFALEPHYVRASEAELKFPKGLGPGADRS